LHLKSAPRTLRQSADNISGTLPQIKSRDYGSGSIGTWIEDGQNDSKLPGFAPVVPPPVVAQALGTTQMEFARALRIPI
jgi:hypothetical protein